jgi:uncharacterized protein (DUF433 family)
MQTVLGINLIVSNPEVRSGRPIMAGTGVCVSDVAVATIFHRKEPDEIAQWYGLSLAQVYAALAYYYEHKPEIDDEIKQRDTLAKELQDKRIGRRHSL